MSEATTATTATARPDFDALFREPPAFGMAVTARGVARTFGQKQVLRHIDLHIEPGQFLAIVGRSGCGKSTLLRLIAGLDAPDRGHIVFGQTGARTAREAVRIMYQEPRLLPWARVLANVEIGLGADRKAADGRARATAALQAMGLGDRGGDWPMALSGGQKQRVAFARALVSRPRVLAFDEPFGALDALTRIEMQQLLEKTWLADRFTALLVTHDVAEAVALADRIVVLEDGEVALDVHVPLPRPRRRGSAEFAALEQRILDRLLNGVERLSA